MCANADCVAKVQRRREVELGDRNAEHRQFLRRRQRFQYYEVVRRQRRDPARVVSEQGREQTVFRV